MLARDSHPFSRLISRAFISGLLAVGVYVDDLEDASLPETRFITAFNRDIDGGTHIRMSDDHGSVVIIELFDKNGLPMGRQDRRKIEALFSRGEFPKISVENVGELRYTGLVHQRYAEHLGKLLNPSSLEFWRGRVMHLCWERSLSRILVDLLGSNQIPNLESCCDEYEPLTSSAYERIAEIARLNHKIAVIIEKNGEQLILVDEVGAIHHAPRTLELLTAVFIITAADDEPVFLQPDHPRFLAELADSRVRKVIITHKDPGAQLNTVHTKMYNNHIWLHINHFYLGYGAVAGVLRLLEFLGNQQLTLHDSNGKFR